MCTFFNVQIFTKHNISHDMSNCAILPAGKRCWRARESSKYLINMSKRQSLDL